MAFRRRSEGKLMGKSAENGGNAEKNHYFLTIILHLFLHSKNTFQRVGNFSYLYIATFTILLVNHIIDLPIIIQPIIVKKKTPTAIQMLSSVISLIDR